MIKAFKVLTVFSTLLFAAILLLVYAYLPISVDLNIEGLASIHKQTLFYQVLVVFIAVNILLRLIINQGFKSWHGSTKAWLSLLIFIVNFYLTLLIGFVGVWNNSTHISPSSYNYLNFIGPVLLVVWLIGLIFLVFKKT
ncbi:MAG: hypothetical protein AAGI25_06550 [Bacteroidota bacterium]